MFNFMKKSVVDTVPTTLEPIQEITSNTPNITKIASVKHLMTTAAIVASVGQSEKIDNQSVEDSKAISIETKSVTLEQPETAETAISIEAKMDATPTSIEPKLSPRQFTPITQSPRETIEQAPAIPKNVSTWFVNNLSCYMNDQPLDKEGDFYTLMDKLVGDDNLNPAPSHIGLHKVKHFIKTQMGHMFDNSKDEFITINLPALDKGVMLMGPTPDNNIVLAGNLSSLETSDWDRIHQSLQAQII